jgi:hypothetical protein
MRHNPAYGIMSPQAPTFAPRRDLGKMLKKHIPGMGQLFDGCVAIIYNFSVYVEGNLSRGVVTSVVSEPELKIDALP